MFRKKKSGKKGDGRMTRKHEIKTPTKVIGKMTHPRRVGKKSNAEKDAT
jgi:hypothetical protein